MSGKKNMPAYVAAAALFLGGFGYLAYSGFSGGSVYFLNVSEAKSAVVEKLTQARLFGTVGESGLAREGENLRFMLLDKDKPEEIIPVVYRGALPDAFKPGAEVIVEGALAPEGHFSARTLMTKCPSKYRKENRKI